ncbi:beta-phosphoglucomutase [Parapedobacter luteus]|uniref:Beta-phosphoglucomutase n=1 Tax=Parapedobacter luteus TaxID=623280 RepID=A0A1T4ZWB2_9SPHI|nr:beta-phosphoglucomutase [Parapedobacter luteus]SKB26633.1 beta-phosphoglucomutase [Parapedobacter luteus]
MTGDRKNWKQLAAGKEAFIFDLDGVLVDTATFHYRAWRRLANELGFDFSMQQNELLKGVSRMQSLEQVLTWGRMQQAGLDKEHLAEKKNAWYLELVERMGPDDVLPGVLAFLRAAKATGIRTALGSASKNARLILDRTGLQGYFDAVIDGNAVVLSKPHPEVFLRAAEALGAAPDACLVFEDAQAGIDAAKAAGMSAVGIGSGTALQRADLVVAGLADLKID